MNSFGRYPFLVAKHLNFPDTEKFTGLAFRRTSATIMENSEMSVDELKQQVGWKSSTVAAAYIIILAFATITSAASTNQSEPIPIINQESEISLDGSYRSSYETGNGITAQEQGVLKSNGENETEEVQGSFQYTAPDGTPIQLSYIANENGFQPQGAHLPVPPEVPAPIQRALEYIAAHPPQEESLD
ncbi:hypothetical protein NQ317_016677 [Molorchus minor]|uniref:Uncharacterized protein n=1 Tax=Molorchus minor TaxID=1323400 RepID=A0ABQ9J3P2_9CUCU|nr:hypothetical protein NQ317_016677 [Molorchus minor]